MFSIKGGMQVGGNLGALAGGNPLLDPRFKIQGGEPWNKTPILPGRETQEYNEQPVDFVPRLPVQNANFGGDGAMIAQSTDNAQGLLQKYLGALLNPFGFFKEAEETLEKYKAQQLEKERVINELLYNR